MLEIVDLTVKYDRIILDKINLKLTERIYGMAGITGSGKTTFIKAILGLIQYEGEILLNGRLLGNRKGFQVVFQNPFNSFNPKRNIKFSIEEIIRLNSTDYSPSELSLKVGINPEQILKYPHELSGGELQRLSIARALAGNPEVLILDEPTSALDVENQRKILDIIRAIENMTVIFISHDRNVLKYISKNILILNEKTRKIEIVNINSRI